MDKYRDKIKNAAKMPSLISRFRSRLLLLKVVSKNSPKKNQPIENQSILFDKDQPFLPVFINNFNRLNSLIKLVSWLERINYVKIIIIDNNSTFPPLLMWYKQTNHRVLLLEENLGHVALWVRSKFAKDQQLQFQEQGDWYVETDSDIVPREDCPLNVLMIFKKLMLEFPYMYKVGFGLEISDIPNYYPLREVVIHWESQFWCNRQTSNAFLAKIDTTFALYNKTRHTRICLDLPPPHHGHDFGPALRTDYPYVARHFPWYLNPVNLEADEKYYIEHAGSCSTWNSQMKAII